MSILLQSSTQLNSSGSAITSGQNLPSSSEIGPGLNDSIAKLSLFVGKLVGQPEGHAEHKVHVAPMSRAHPFGIVMGVGVKEIEIHVGGGGAGKAGGES